MENDFQGYFDNADMTAGQGAAIGGALGTVVPGVGNVVGAAVGAGIVTVLPAIEHAWNSVFGGGSPDHPEVTLQFKTQMQSLKTSLLIQPNLTIQDIIRYNSVIDSTWSSYTHPWPYFIYQRDAGSGKANYNKLFLVPLPGTNDYKNIASYSYKGYVPPYTGLIITYHDLAIQTDYSQNYGPIINVDTMISDSDILTVAKSLSYPAGTILPNTNGAIVPTASGAIPSQTSKVVNNSQPNSTTTTGSSLTFGLSTTTVVIIVAAIIGIIIFAIRK